ncbi:MAG: hypothetical protein JW928_02655 [Candidatus Aureabacteria bacterium]|nr:hypothetical protein [Candidatus Auribacterota bacterium]
MRNVAYTLHRMKDPSLFPNDPLADMSEKLAPAGWKALFRFSGVFFDALLFSKLLSHLLYALSVWMVFLIGKNIRGLLAGAVSTLLFLHDPFFLNRMSGGLPRAFYIPLVLFMIYFTVRSWVPGLSLTVLLCGLLYPVSLLFAGAFLAVQIFIFRMWPRGKAAILIVFFLVSAFLLFNFDESPGDLVTFKEAERMEEFAEEGRVPVLPMKNPVKESLGYFFSPFFAASWSRSYEIGYGQEKTDPVGMISAFLLFFAGIWGLARQKGSEKAFLFALIVSSLILYLLARIFFFRLYYPYRYLYPLSLSSVFIVGAGFAGLAGKMKEKGLLLGTILLVFFFTFTDVRIVPYNGFLHFTGQWRSLFMELRNTVSDAVFAGNVYVLDNVPVFSKRSVFISDEMIIPFFKDSYPERKERLIENAKIVYSRSREECLEICQRCGIDYIIIYKPDFTREHALQGRFYVSRPLKNSVISIVEDRTDFYLSRVSKDVIFFETKSFSVIDVAKLRKIEEK